MNRFHRWLCQSAIWRRALERKLLPWVLEGIDLSDDLLELGPGPGLTTEFLRKRVARLTAIEIDSRLADSLKCRMDGTNVWVVKGDATDMPFQNGSFSAVVSLTPCSTTFRRLPYKIDCSQRSTACCGQTASSLEWTTRGTSHFI